MAAHPNLGKIQPAGSMLGMSCTGQSVHGYLPVVLVADRGGVSGIARLPGWADVEMRGNADRTGGEIRSAADADYLQHNQCYL